MYCQQCGAQLRQTARFCNKCGVAVRQRFPQAGAPPKPDVSGEGGKLPTRAGANQPPAPRSWAPVGETLIMPAVNSSSLDAPPGEAPERPEEKRLAAAAQAERPMIFESSAPKPAAPATPPVSADAAPPASRRESPKPVWRDAARKPVFTQVMPAAANKQHNRLMIVVPILIVIFIGVLVLAYVAAK